jgi:hypothetical protein
MDLSVRTSGETRSGNKRDQAILDWCKKHRPDIVPKMEILLIQEATLFLISVAFEAGRHFQAETGFELDNPNLY